MLNKKLSLFVLGVSVFISTLLIPVSVLAHGTAENIPGHYFVRVKAHDKYQRTAIQEMGLTIDGIVSDSVYGTASPSVYDRIKDSKVEIVESFKITEVEQSDFGTLDFPTDFPADDSKFHNVTELNGELKKLEADYPNIVLLSSIGKTVEGRDIWCVQINTNAAKARKEGKNSIISGKPGIVFMGNHHAREHVSAEIPLMQLKYLLENYKKDQEVTRLIDTRDIFYIPMVNPDGVEYDISNNKYHMHRKNMTKNKNGTLGVDLNRNYGFQWGTGGSSKDPSSDVYMGTAPFSEPESNAVKGFVEAHPNLKILLSFHTFSELILYPWGHKYDSISTPKDLAAFEAMAKTMAKWNGYTPQQSSDLYIASGDTTDWAYGARGIFAFTFELSPKSMWDGGFYPGQKILDRVFNDNLKPMLYLIDISDDPHRASAGKNDYRLSWLYGNELMF